MAQKRHFREVLSILNHHYRNLFHPQDVIDP